MPYFKTSENINLYYEILKSKNYLSEKIVLINGLGSPIGYWLDFPKKLCENFEVLIYDNRGIGKSSNSKNIYFIDDLENDLKELLNYIGWEKYNLLGISLGGFIALKHTEKNLGKVRNLILVSSHPGIQYMKYPLHNPILEFFKWKLLSKEQRIEEIIKFNAGTDLKKLKPELYRQIYNSRMKEKVAIDLNFWQQSLAGSFFSGIKYKNITTPVLIIHGKNDKVVPYNNAYIFEKLFVQSPKIKVKIFEDAGHLCLWEKEKEIIDELFIFVLYESYAFNKQF